MSYKVEIKRSAVKKDPLIQKIHKKHGKVLSFESEEKAEEWVNDLSKWSFSNPTLQNHSQKYMGNRSKKSVNAYLTAR